MIAAFDESLPGKIGIICYDISRIIRGDKAGDFDGQGFWKSFANLSLDYFGIFTIVFRLKVKEFFKSRFLKKEPLFL